MAPGQAVVSDRCRQPACAAGDHLLVLGERAAPEAIAARALAMPVGMEIGHIGGVQATPCVQADDLCAAPGFP